MAGLSDRLKKAFKQHSITTAFKPTNTLRSKLVNVKDKTPRDKRSHLVYGYKCPDKECHHTYVGETKQAFKKRLQQHRKPSYGDSFDSAIFTHIQESGHNFDNKDVLILDRDDRWFERGVKEAVWERIEHPSLTTKLRFTLSHTWD